MRRSSPAYDPEQFADNYPDGIERHYWNVARNRVIADLLHRHAAGARLLEIGCGRGVVVDYLRQRGWGAWGCDLGEADPIGPRVAPHLFLGRDAFELEEIFRERIEAILLLDLLEHLDQPEQFLTRCRSAFPHARTALLTLPARRELWSNYDVRFGHFRRYDPASLTQLLARAGVAAIEAGYFFHTLYLPMRLTVALGLDRRTEVVAPSGSITVGAHRALGRVLALEARLLPGWIPGSSIYALVEL